MLWFNVHYDAAEYKEIFNVNILSDKLDQRASPNLQDIFIGSRAWSVVPASCRQLY